MKRINKLKFECVLKIIATVLPLQLQLCCLIQATQFTVQG